MVDFRGGMPRMWDCREGLHLIAVNVDIILSLWSLLYRCALSCVPWCAHSIAPFVGYMGYGIWDM